MSVWAQWPYYKFLPISAIFERLEPLVGHPFADVGYDQERNRGAELHRLVCQRLGYVQDANGGMRFVQTATEFVAMQQAIAYYRVSTARQGRSGLGIEAQREAVARFSSPPDPAR